MTLVGLAGPVRRALDRLAFLDDDRLRLDRAALLLLAEALPRRRERHRLIAMQRGGFRRFTAGPWRLRRPGPAAAQPADRPAHGGPPAHRAGRPRAAGPGGGAAGGAAGERGPAEAARAVRHRPRSGGTTTRSTSAACSACGRTTPAVHTDGLDRDARRALDWFRRYVPRRPAAVAGRGRRGWSPTGCGASWSAPTRAG